MDWKQFFADLVSSISWPGIVLIAIIIFKVELNRILQRIAHFKFKDIEMDFEKVNQQIEDFDKDLDKSLPKIENPVLLSLENQVTDAIKSAPSAAILLAWSGIETVLASTVSRLSISPESPSLRSPTHNLDMLIKYANFSESVAIIIHDMRNIRNKTAHNVDISSSIDHDFAEQYANASFNIIQIIERLDSKE